VRLIPAIGAAIVLGTLTSLAMSPLRAETSTPGHGAWQEHRYSFVYMGFTSTYSCDGLADKLKLLLVAAGARGDAKVSPGACASGFGQPDKFARAELTFHTLVPDAQGGPGSSGAPSATAGAWRPVSISNYRPRELRTGDCELVEQFKSNVLPLLSARNVENHTTCVPHQDSGSQIDLKFETFAALPQPAAATTRK
jgi:hypothetical protein